jgi:hypothetical protein
LPEPFDKWWDLTGGDADDHTIEEVLHLIGERALPYLQEHASDAALIQLWESGQSPGITAHLCKRYLTTLKLAGVADHPGFA